MAKDIVVQTTKAVGDYPKGAELGFTTEAKATSALGEGTFKVVRHQDNSAYEASAAPKPQGKRKSRANTPAPTPVTPEVTSPTNTEEQA